MNPIRTLISFSLIGFSLLSATLAAQEMPADKTERKDPLDVWGVQFEEFEYRYSDSGEEVGVWDADIFYGTDELKVRWLTSGEYAIEEQVYEGLENQFVAQIPISEFFDAKAGVRFDTPAGPDRTYGVLGLSGLAPQWIELEANLYHSNKGKTSAELEAEYELLLTNYWILAATFESTVAFNQDREIGVGTGLVSTETGLRLSYDLVDRAVSPYVGVVHEKTYGETADFARADGGGTEDWFAVIGARLVF